jgi:formylglycine-generating enzyme required for sulfatase activity
MTKKGGHPYRLLSEAEYEYVNRAGTTTAYFWGDDYRCDRTNGLGQDRTPLLDSAPCYDGYPDGSPVGHFPANAFGLYDTTGNVWEWTQDCYHETYDGAPTDGSAWTSGDCRYRIIRGGSHLEGPRKLRSAYRYAWLVDPITFTNGNIGLRLARKLP